MSDPKAGTPTGDQSDQSDQSDHSDDGASGEPSEAQRRFREALDRKKSLTGEHPGNAGAPGQRLKQSNSKRQRQFRRKSG